MIHTLAERQASITQTLHCLHCGKRQRRHLRTGHWFRCRYCKELNPGPEMVASMNRAALGRRKPKAKGAAVPEPSAEPTPEPAPAAAVATPEAPPPKAAAKPTRRTVRKSAAPARRQAAAQGPPQAAPSAAPESSEQPKKQGSLWDRVLYGG